MRTGIIIPARNEEDTVGGVARAALEASEEIGGTVVVVADHCTDRTAAVADRAGAHVLELHGSSPSKARAVRAGIVCLGDDTDVVVTLDADSTGLTKTHVTTLCAPVLEGYAAMSVGIFDYGPAFSWLVVRLPWSTGQRAFIRDLFPMDDVRLQRYNIELLLDEAVGKRDSTTVSQVMHGLGHRSKIVKAGLRSGVPGDVRMWSEIARSASEIDRRACWRYLNRLVVIGPDGLRVPSRALAVAGFASLEAAASLLRAFSPHQQHYAPAAQMCES